MIIHRIVTFASGDFAYEISKPASLRARTVRSATHGDWKTNVARGERPTVSSGQEVTIVKIWNNFEGTWCSIEFDGQGIDIRPLDLQLL